VRFPILATIALSWFTACQPGHGSFSGPLAALADSVLSFASDARCGPVRPLGATDRRDTAAKASQACTSSGDTTVVVEYDDAGRVVVVWREWMTHQSTDSVYSVLLARLKRSYGEPQDCVRKNDHRLPHHVFWNATEYHPCLATTIYGAVSLSYGLAPPVCDKAAA